MNSREILQGVGFVLVAFVVYACLSSPSQAGAFVELGIGKNGLLQTWEGSDSTACMFGAGYQKMITEDVEVEVAYQHFSQCTRGLPFDSRSEDTLDSVGVWVRWHF